MQLSQAKIRRVVKFTWEAYDDARVKSPGMIQSSVNRRLLHVTADEGRLEFISALFRARVEKTHSRFLHYRYILFKKKKKKGWEWTCSGLSVLESRNGRLHEIFEGSQGLFQSRAHLWRGARDALHQRGVQADHLSPRVVVHCRRNTNEWRNKRGRGGEAEKENTINCWTCNQSELFLPDRIPTCARKQSRLSKHLEGN